jgi:lipid A 3-O-deacylase
MNKFHPKFLAGGMLAIAAAAHGGTLGDLSAEYNKARTEGKTWHTLEIDNDSMLLNRDDGLYTSGLRYTQMHVLRTAESVTGYGWRIGQELYSPSDIKLPPELVGPPDHPYAGWLYGGFFKDVRRADGSGSRFGIDIGCIGPCAGGEWTQTQLHRLINQPLPQGWSKQVRNEVGVMLYADLTPVRWQPASAVDISPILKARFGNIFTDASAGLLLRAGRLDTLPGDPTLHVFLRADVNAVAYNATLQGGYFSNNNPHTVDPQRVVGEAQVGVAWTSGPYGLKAVLIRRGNEIRDLPDSVGTQNYLRLQFTYIP